jgi:Flp pilus assembly protein protease CpaA
MRLLSIDFWALWCGFGLIILAAVASARTYRVPNLLSLPATGAGWLTALLVSCSVGVPSHGGGIVASLTVTLVALLLLLPLYLTGVMGAGCIKMHAAFGAWLGCVLPLVPALLLVGLGTSIGVFLAWIWYYLTKIRAIDSNAGENVQWDAGVIPAQVPLSIGLICGAAAPLAVGLV